VNNPTILSSSFSILQQTNPSSVFYNAIKELFVDSALRNVTMVQANNDFGSGWSFATGLANRPSIHSSPFMLLVGGTSGTTMAAAQLDPTIALEPTPGQSLYGPRDCKRSRDIVAPDGKAASTSCRARRRPVRRD
jgi:hypothetical protein